MERNVARRSNAGAVITTLLSLLVVAAAVAIVAYFVLRAPSSTVDSAERLEPVGTALPAPTEQPSLPTPVPTTDPQPVLGFTGEQPSNSGLPTVAAEPETPAPPTPAPTGPTPTPRVLALPTTAPPTPPPPPPTLPPAQATSVPVVALQPVESAPPPTVAPQEVAPGPTPTPAAVDTDPLDVFGENDPPRIVPTNNEAMERVRAIQEEREANRNQRRARNNERGRENDATEIVAPVAPAIVPGDGGAVEIIVPDVDAMIDEITARALDPNRNPNVSDITGNNRGRSIRDSDREDDKRNSRKRNSNRGRNNRRTTTQIEIPSIQPGPGNGGNADDCPFANLPADQRPKDWPFGNC